MSSPTLNPLTQHTPPDATSDHLGYGEWTDVVRSPVGVVWLLLMVATTISWIMGNDHGLDSTEATSVLVLLIAFVKIRFVAMYFMEAGHALAPIKWTIEAAWIILALVVVICFLTL